MLSAQNRLGDPQLFRKAFRFGSRAGNAKLVVHVLAGEVFEKERLVGFVVPKKVFPKAVSRNRVKRQLRHICKEHLDQLPLNSILVVRVLEGSRSASFSQLESAFVDALERALSRSGK